MNAQTIRLVLFGIIVVSGMMLYQAWQKETATDKVTTVTSKTAKSALDDKEIPDIVVSKKNDEVSSVSVQQNEKPAETVAIKTDVFDLAIDKQGGDITHLILSDYAESEKQYGQGFILLNNTGKRYYIAQTGLTGEDGPDKRGVGRALFESAHNHYVLEEGHDHLSVDFKTKTDTGVDIIKRFSFKRGSYVIDIEYLIYNRSQKPYLGNFYARLKRKPEESAGGGFLGIQTFTGAAIYTPETPYKKITFKDMAKKPVEAKVEGGYAAMVEHYFVSAFIPASDSENNYQAQQLSGDTYSVGFIEPTVTVLPNEEKTIKTQLYAGPEITEDLAKLAPGLDLTVDYGMLWPICKPIFWLLKKAFQLTGNWGLAIILTTIVIKGLFYKLSASSYRSMGNMRKLQPKLEALKERYPDDKQKYGQAVMELYKKEKINPVGGCLPILVQIPVFIALYYVLLGSVELREAPFYLWITDLSDKDPYYVLPILMGLSMVVQQKLNPAPPDPMQAKVMMFMPIVFTVLFLNFPAGLVLYWFVNNILSITQQWFMMRHVVPTSGSK